MGRFKCSQDEQPQDREDALRTATVTLLMEVARADDGVDDAERLLIEQLVERNYAVTAARAREIARQAEQQAEHSTSLYPLTRLLVRECSIEERIELVRLLWAVIFADGHVDKHEEHLVRKIADLLYVPHNQYIKAKLSC